MVNRRSTVKFVETPALILTFSPPSSLRFDAIAPKPKAKADRRRNSHCPSFISRMTVRQSQTRVFE
jgi:hypothetical protein